MTPDTNPKGDVADQGEVLAKVREALEDVRDHATVRIQDGIEMGATVWRLALEDCQRIAREALSLLGDDR